MDEHADQDALERAARTWAEHARPTSAVTAFVAGAKWQRGIDASETASVAPEPMVAGTAFLKFKVTDASLGTIRDDVAEAILDGVRRALAKIDVAADA